jgi:UDP-N-acetylglucosamine 2-epimerase (non-hydrolysing)
MNPAVREVVCEELGALENVHIIEPLDIFDMHNLMAKSHLILTDSGGIQEEAPSFNVPVVVLRTSTERPEALETGATVLAGVEESDIYNISKELLTDKEKYDKMARAKNPYGDGTASRQIVDIIEKEVE